MLLVLAAKHSTLIMLYFDLIHTEEPIIQTSLIHKDKNATVLFIVNDPAYVVVRRKQTLAQTHDRFRLYWTHTNPHISPLRKPVASLGYL